MRFDVIVDDPEMLQKYEFTGVEASCREDAESAGARLALSAEAAHIANVAVFAEARPCLTREHPIHWATGRDS